MGTCRQEKTVRRDLTKDREVTEQGETMSRRKVLGGVYSGRDPSEGPSGRS